MRAPPLATSRRPRILALGWAAYALMPPSGSRSVASRTPLVARSQGHLAIGHDDGLALMLMTRFCSRAPTWRALRWRPGQQGLDAHHAPVLPKFDNSVPISAAPVERNHGGSTTCGVSSAVFAEPM